MSNNTIPSIHPGEILLEEFLKPLGISQYKLAKDIAVPATRIAAIVKGERAISADTALRLARYFNTSKDFWLNLQKHYELELAESLLSSGENELQRICPVTQTVILKIFKSKKIARSF